MYIQSKKRNGKLVISGLSEPGFDPGTCGLWAHHASAAPLWCCWFRVWQFILTLYHKCVRRPHILVLPWKEGRWGDLLAEERIVAMATTFSEKKRGALIDDGEKVQSQSLITWLTTILLFIYDCKDSCFLVQGLHLMNWSKRQSNLHMGGVVMTDLEHSRTLLWYMIQMVVMLHDF